MSNADAIRVLHVDDEPDFADIVATFLEREDDRITVQTVNSPTAGLELLSDRDFDCIVSDYDMPAQNGIEFLDAVREKYSELPFILYTGKGSEEIASEAISAGVTDYLQKESGTGQYTVLANRIKNSVEQYRSRQAVQETEQKLSELAERTDDVLFMFDGDWSELLFVNSAYEEIWGGSIEELEKNPSSFLENIRPEDREEVRVSMDQLSNGEPSQIEYRIVRRDGEQRWVRADAQPIPDEDGNVVRIVGQVRDITGRRERELHLETIIDNLPGYVYRHGYDSQYPLQFVKGDAETVTGYTATELEEDVILAEEIIHPEDRENLWAEHLEGIETTGRFDSTYRIITKNGDVRWIRDQGQLIEDPMTGEAVIDGFITDVSNRILRERELRRQQTFIDESLDALQDVFYAIDGDGDLICWNDRVSELSGYTDDEIDEIVITELFAEEHHNRIGESIKETMETGSSAIRADVLTADGERIPFEFRKTRLTDLNREKAVAVGVGRDISGQVKRERQLEQYEQIVETMDDVAFVVDDKWTVAFTNRSILEYIDVSLDALEGQPVMGLANKYVAEEDGPSRFEQALERAFERGNVSNSPERVELTLDTDRGQMTFEYQFSPLVSNGVTEAVVITMRDITKHMRHAEQLRALNERSQMLMSANTKEQIAKIGVEATREILELDANAIHLYDEDADALVPAAISDAASELIGEPPTFRGNDSIAWRVYQREEPLAVNDVHEDPDRYNPDTPIRSELLLPLGAYGILLAGSPSPNMFNDQDVLIAKILASGLTAALEQVERTEQLRTRERELTKQNDRLEEFASIVSHDLRNPLTVATGRLELAAAECDSEHLGHVEQAHERMQTLIEDLLTLAREGEAVADLEPVVLAPLIEECWATVETGEATLVTDIECTVQADKSRLKQLFENLMRNSVEHGGEDVTVTVGELDDGFYVEDDGPGIPSNERERIFEAGYSTGGDGTGFGLNIVKQIVDAHGWQIRTTEGTAGGARFEIAGVETTAE